MSEPSEPLEACPSQARSPASDGPTIRSTVGLRDGPAGTDCEEDNRAAQCSAGPRSEAAETTGGTTGRCVLPPAGLLLTTWGKLKSGNATSGVATVAEDLASARETDTELAVAADAATGVAVEAAADVVADVALDAAADAGVVSLGVVTDAAVLSAEAAIAGVVAATDSAGLASTDGSKMKVPPAPITRLVFATIAD